MMSSKPTRIVNASGQLRAIVSVALFCVATSPPAWSQSNDDAYADAEGHELTASAENFDRYEAERLRQQQQQHQQKMKLFENERVRQENERREQEQLRFESERRAQEQLRLEREARERELVQTAELQRQTEQTSQTVDPDIYEQLRTIGQLRDDGILTEQEFQDLKKRILD